jgi:hypothetical protein
MLPNSRRMREGLATWLVEIPVADATLADIYFMAWGREPQHVALITDKGIIHSYFGVGKVVEHALTIAGGGGLWPPTVSRILLRIHKWLFLLLVSLALD